MSSVEEQRCAVMKRRDEGTRAPTLVFINAGVHFCIHQRRRPPSYPGVMMSSEER